MSGDKRDILELSQMSPAARARLSALIEADGDADLRQHLLGAMGRKEASRRGAGKRNLPDRWTQIHALDRLEEAYEVLAGMPMATRPKVFGGAWPSFQQEKLAIGDQVNLMETGELEHLHQDRNRVRLPPTTAQITRMEQALRWPFEYLADRPELARAISLRAMWSAMHVDIKKRCRHRGIDHDRFNADWQAGLNAITAALIVRKVPVS